jgi:Laminin EGF domain
LSNLINCLCMNFRIASTTPRVLLVIAVQLAISEIQRWLHAELVHAPLPKPTELPAALLAETMFRASVRKDTLGPDAKGLFCKKITQDSLFIVSHFRCSYGFFGFPMIPGGSCQPCNCDSRGSVSDECHEQTGQCNCRPGVGGRDCTQCPHGHILGDRGCSSEYLKFIKKNTFLKTEF